MISKLCSNCCANSGGTNRSTLLLCKRCLSALLKSDSQIYLCAIDGEDVVGFASLTIKTNLWQGTNLGHIDELIVDKNIAAPDLGRSCYTR
jgi:hypothetical protein